VSRAVHTFNITLPKRRSNLSTRIEFDLPSSLFGQFNSPKVTVVTRSVGAGLINKAEHLVAETWWQRLEPVKDDPCGAAASSIMLLDDILPPRNRLSSYGGSFLRTALTCIRHTNSELPGEQSREANERGQPLFMSYCPRRTFVFEGDLRLSVQALCGSYVLLDPVSGCDSVRGTQIGVVDLLSHREHRDLPVADAMHFV